MKKRMWVCSFVLTTCLFHLSISNFVFGQEQKSPAQQVFDNYKNLLQREDIQKLFPGFLRIFKRPDLQRALKPTTIETILNNPLSYQELDPKIDNQFLLLLSTDDELRTLFRDEQFYTVFEDPQKIEELAGLIEGERPLIPTTLVIVSGDDQNNKTGTKLPRPFEVKVLNQDGNPLPDVEVTFEVTKGGGQTRHPEATTNKSGEAQTTLTLGSNVGVNKVKASVVDYPSLTQTFTAAATTAAITAAICPTEPVVPVRSSTEEPPMYWIAGNSIYYRPTGGGKEIFLEPKEETLTGGLAVDMKGEKVYWTEQTIDNMGRIQSADLDDSTNVKTVQAIMAVPYDIAFDAKKRKLYWTSSFGKIQSINVDGTDFRGDFHTGLETPQQIAFDVAKRRLYWTAADGIWSIYTDNDTGIPRRLSNGDLGELGGIAVFDDVVYWTEQTSSGGKVRSVYRNGSDSKSLLATTESIPGGIAVDAVGGKVYWTTSHGIRNAPLIGETVVIREEEPAGIALGGTVDRVGVPAGPAAPSVSSVGSVENTLLANYPNPFNPETWIPYRLSEPADVSVSIYAVDGTLVRRLDLGHQSAGVYRSRSRAAYWDGWNAFGERVASGLYFYTLTAGDFTATRKMLIRK